MTPTTGLQAYCWGYEAALAGVPLWSNPFILVQANGQAWDQGHQDACQDAKYPIRAREDRVIERDVWLAMGRAV